MEQTEDNNYQVRYKHGNEGWGSVQAGSPVQAAEMYAAEIYVLFRPRYLVIEVRGPEYATDGKTHEFAFETSGNIELTGGATLERKTIPYQVRAVSIDPEPVEKWALSPIDAAKEYAAEFYAKTKKDYVALEVSWVTEEGTDKQMICQFETETVFSLKRTFPARTYRKAANHEPNKTD